MKITLTAGLLCVVLVMPGWTGRSAQAGERPPVPSADLPPEQGEGPAIRLRLTPKERGEITGLAFSPDGKTLAAGNGEAMVHFYDTDTARERRPAWDNGTTESIRGVAYAPDGSLLAFGSYDRVILLDTATNQHRITLHIPRPPNPQDVAIQAVAFAPDGTAVAAAGYHGQIEVWDVTTGRVRAVIQGPIVPYPRQFPDGKVRGRPAHIQGLAYSPDGKTLASGGVDGVIRLWDPAAGQERSKLDAGDPFKAKFGAPLAYSPDGTILATGAGIASGPDRSEHLVALWDTATWQQRVVLRGHAESVTDVRFLPSGKTLASLGWDQTVRLWDVATGRQLDALRFEHHSRMRHLAVSPDGKLLAAGGCESDPRFGAIELIETDGTTLRHRDPRH
jgi:WD40 repeat protein